jgi:hypothetical protein
MDGGGRAAGADREPVVQRAAELIAEHEAREIAETAEKVAAALAHGLSVTGTVRVVEALRKGQVETLVLADGGAHETLFVGSSPLELGMNQQELDALGAPEAHSAPADRALLAAAVASSADVVLLPRSAMLGDVPVAAVLRYTDAATPAQ